MINKSTVYLKSYYLFICKSIIEAHGGKIWATNNLEEKGATFFFTLPVMITEIQAPRGSSTSNR